MDDQCKGKTKSGTPCKIKTNLIEGYCRLHQDQNPKAGTAAGAPAKAGPTPASKAESRRNARKAAPQPAAAQIEETPVAGQPVFDVSPPVEPTPEVKPEPTPAPKPLASAPYGSPSSTETWSPKFLALAAGIGLLLLVALFGRLRRGRH